MKKFGIIIIFVLLGQAVNAQEYLNKVGFDLASYIVMTPKYNLPGNKYNPYATNSSSGAFGLYYERFFKKHDFSLKTGCYINEQFLSVASFYVPIDYNKSVFGNARQTTFYAGYTAGININIMSNLSPLPGGGYFIPLNVISEDFSLKKRFYIAPHAGINAGINLKHIFFSFQGLYDFFIPQFASFKTVYKNSQGKTITEYNTNKNWGFSLRLGMGVRF